MPVAAPSPTTRIRLWMTWGFIVAVIAWSSMFISSPSSDAAVGDVAQVVIRQDSFNSDETTDWMTPTVTYVNHSAQGFSVTLRQDGQASAQVWLTNLSGIETGSHPTSATENPPTLKIRDGLDGCENGGNGGGSFDIIEYEENADSSFSVSIDFSIRCGLTQWVGSLRFNSTVEIDRIAIAEANDFDDPASFHLAAPLPYGRRGGERLDMVDPDTRIGGVTDTKGALRMVIGSPAKYLELNLTAGGEPLQPGTYAAEGSIGYPDPTEPVIEVHHTSGCWYGNTGTSFVIHEIEIDDSGALTSLALDFHLECSAYKRGSVRLNSSYPIDFEPIDSLLPPGFLYTQPTSCPSVTDSIFRLYTAYFLREPDGGGWGYWNTVYPQDNVNLVVMSDAFAESTEFKNTYGSLSNEAFVDLVYQNVMGRTADAAGRAHWSGALGRGLSRGELMVAFSESKEYVLRTGTMPPLAGYLQWYDKRVRFKCGSGRGSFWVNEPLPESAHADVFIINRGPQDIVKYGFRVPDGGTASTELYELETFQYSGAINLSLDQWGADSAFIETNSTGIDWVVVFYDHPHAAGRDPWFSG